MSRDIKDLIKGQYIFGQTVVEAKYVVRKKIEYNRGDFSNVSHLIKGIDDKSPWIVCIPDITATETKYHKIFPLIDDPELHQKFGNLYYKDEDQILSFVRQYGFLGYSFPMEKVYRQPKTSQQVFGESLLRWQTEILLIQHCMSLWKHSYSGGTSTTDDIKWLRKHVVWDAKGIDILYPGPDRLHHFRLCGPAEHQNIYKLMKSGDVYKPAQLYVIQCINDHLFSNMDMSLQPFIKRKDYEIIFTPKNLLSTMWYLFMKEILGIHYEDKNLRYCSECGKPFLARMGAQTCNDKCRQRKSRRMQDIPKIG